MVFSFIISIILWILELAANWRVYQKMGRQGWEGLIPLYNTFIQFKLLYGNGWKMLLQLIPGYGIYVSIKFSIDLAHAFNKTTGFGWGLFLLSTIFTCILGFGKAEYLDGSAAIVSNDAISNALNNIADDVANKTSGTGNAAQKNQQAISMLREMGKLHSDEILTDEEFKMKKDDMLKRIGIVGNASNAAGKAKMESSAMDLLKELAQLRNEGILTNEELQEKKTELLEQIGGKEEPAAPVKQPAPAAKKEPTTSERLVELAKMHDEGILSDEEFEKMKAELLKTI